MGLRASRLVLCVTALIAGGLAHADSNGNFYRLMSLDDNCKTWVNAPGIPLEPEFSCSHPSYGGGCANIIRSVCQQAREFCAQFDKYPNAAAARKEGEKRYAENMAYAAQARKNQNFKVAYQYEAEAKKQRAYFAEMGRLEAKYGATCSKRKWPLEIRAKREPDPNCDVTPTLTRTGRSSVNAALDVARQYGGGGGAGGGSAGPQFSFGRGSGQSFCLNKEFGIEGSDLELERFNDGQITTSEEVRSFLERRMKAQGLDTAFLKRCIGYVPADLWSVSLAGTGALSLDDAVEQLKVKRFRDYLKGSKDDCLNVVLNPKYAEWVPLISLGATHTKFVDKDGVTKSCDNISDERYYDPNKMDPSMAAALNALSPGMALAQAAFERTSANNLNTAEARYAGSILGRESNTTYLPRSQVANACPSTKFSESSPVTAEAITAAAENYQKACVAMSDYYANVKLVTTIVEDVVVIEVAGTLIVASGGTAIPVLLGTSAAVGVTTGIRVRNGCVDQSAYGAQGSTQAEDEAILRDCFNQAVEAGAEEAAFNAILGGVGARVSRAFTGVRGSVARRFVVDSTKEVAPELFAQVPRSLRIGVGTAEQLAHFGTVLTAAVARCVAENNLDTSKCDARAIGKTLITSLVIGKMVSRAMRLGEPGARKPTKAELKKQTQLALKSAELKELKQNLGSGSRTLGPRTLSKYEAAISRGPGTELAKTQARQLLKDPSVSREIAEIERVVDGLPPERAQSFRDELVKKLKEGGCGL